MIPVFAFFAYLNHEIAEISGLTQRQNDAVASQHEILTRQAELADLQDRAYQRQAELLTFITLTDNRLRSLEKIQLEFSRLERATFSAALSRRVNQQVAMAAQRRIFIAAIDSATAHWPDLTASLTSEYELYAENMDKVSQTLGKRNKRPAVKLFLEKVKPISESINAKLTEAITSVTASQAKRVKKVSGTIGQLRSAAEQIELTSEQVKEASNKVDELAEVVATRVSVLKQLSVLAAMGLLLIGPIFAIWLAKYISSPLVTLTKAMDQMSNGNLNQHVAVTSGNEIGSLEKGFNLMSSQLARAHTELDKNREELAQKVEERTRDLNLAKEEAESASRAKSEFLATMSHEIRTPMNGVIGMTELLLSTEMDNKQKKFAATVHRSANSLLGIINDILDFSKIESGKMDLCLSDFDLRNLMEDTAEMFAERADDKGIELLCDIPANLAPTWRGDAEKIGQIVNNLIGNAIKFTDSGEVALRVTVDTVSEFAARVKIAVRDTGIGIPMPHQRQIFDSFVQADASTTRIYGGTGLGLAICKQLVELMDGKIGVFSQPGEGSEFWCEFELPYFDSTNAQLTNTDKLKGLRVLVVDDNETNREILHHQLMSWQMSDVPAKDGAAGLDILYRTAERNDTFDLIILDMHMPNMDGLQFAQHVVNDPAISGTPTIMLSSVCDVGTTEELTAVGIGCSLSKPARQAELLNAIQSTLFGQQAEPKKKSSGTVKYAEALGADILLVEDNPINQEVAKGMLDTLGCRVSVAEDGLEALSLLDEKHFDLVLMDCQMPRMDGFTATGKIRSNENDASTRLPIIALTANAMSGDKERCIAAGMDGYLGKPIAIDALRNALLEHLPLTVQTTKGNVEQPESRQVSESSPAARKGINTAMLDNMRNLQGGDAIVERVVDMFTTDTPGQLQKIHSAIVENECELLSQIAHKLKSGSANVGASQMAKICALLEAAGRSKDLSGADALLAKMEVEYREVCRELNDLIPNRAA